jgi:hypothetical protein
MLGGRDRAIASDEVIANAERLAKEKYLACAFILGADKTRDMEDYWRIWKILLHRAVINFQRP